MRFLLLCAAIILSVRAQAPKDVDGSCPDISDQDNVQVLMDSRNYRSLIEEVPLSGEAGWTSFVAGGASPGWAHSIGGVCQRQVRSCNFRSTEPQENWLITQHISKFTPDTAITYPVTINIEVSWRYSSCSSGGCDFPLEIYTYLTDEPTSPTDFTDTSKYSLLGTITPQLSSNPQGTSSFRLDMQPGEEGFYLAVVDRGVCAQISRLLVYRGRCAGSQNGLTIFPNTATPMAEQGEVEVQAKCVQDASSVDDLSLICSAEGEWSGSPSCSCNPGFVERQDGPTGLGYCEACQAGFYRSSSDVTCQSCPANTVLSGVGVGECACLDSHFRASTDASEACQPVPSGDISLAVSAVTASSISLSWMRPSVTGNNLFYRIALSNPEDIFGNLLEIESRYVRNGDVVTYTIDGLLPFTQYQVQVSVHNDVSDQDLVNKAQRVQQQVVKTDPAAPEAPTNVQGLCSFVLWGEPPAQSCELIGYEIEFQSVNNMLVALVPKDVSDRFHEVDSSIMSAEEGPLIFRIRAICSSFTGEWSDIFPVCDEAPSEGDLTVCEECPSCELPDPTVVPLPNVPGVIKDVFTFPDGIVIWTPPSEEVTKYTIRIYFYNRRGARTGTQTDIVGAEKAWVKLSDSFSSFVQGVEYFVQVRAANDAGSSLYTSEMAVVF